MPGQSDSEEHQTESPSESKGSIEDFLASLLGSYRRQKRGLLSAELRTLSSLSDFASAATQIHATLVSVRAIHAVMAAANCLGAVRQLMDQLLATFDQKDLKLALSSPPGPRLRKEIGDLAGAFFERAEAAAIELKDPRWDVVLRRHGGRATTGIVDYCQRLADDRAVGLSLPRNLSREIHLSMSLLARLKPTPI